MKPLRSNPPISGTRFSSRPQARTDAPSAPRYVAVAILSLGIGHQRAPHGYIFRVIATGKTEYVPARYTFVYANRDGEWLIALHHSSLTPAS